MLANKKEVNELKKEIVQMQTVINHLSYRVADLEKKLNEKEAEPTYFG